MRFFIVYVKFLDFLLNFIQIFIKMKQTFLDDFLILFYSQKSELKECSIFIPKSARFNFDLQWAKNFSLPPIN